MGDDSDLPEWDNPGSPVDDYDDTDMTSEEFDAALNTSIPVTIVSSREDYDDEIIGLADVAAPDERPWPAHLDPAKGWLRCKVQKGFYCTGVLHKECRPEGFVMPEQYRPRPWDPSWVVAPGSILEEFMQTNDMSTEFLSTACGKMPVEIITGLLAGELELTQRMARALEMGTGITSYMWLNLERNFRRGLAEGKTWSR